MDEYVVNWVGLAGRMWLNTQDCDGADTPTLKAYQINNGLIATP